MVDSNFESLTAKEVASIFRVSTQTVYRMLKTGTLRGYKVNVSGSNYGMWRVTKDELERFVHESFLWVEQGRTNIRRSRKNIVDEADPIMAMKSARKKKWHKANDKLKSERGVNESN